MPAADDKRAAFRYDVDTPVQGDVAGHSFAGRLRDVSVTGAAVVGIEDVGFDNNQFVNLHMEGIGARSGYVRRTIPQGFALEFDAAEDDDAKRQEDIAKFRALSARHLNG